MGRQVEMGYAWEGALVLVLEERLAVVAVDDEPSRKVRAAFDALDEPGCGKMRHAAGCAVDELLVLDRRLHEATHLKVVPTSTGRHGSPVDIEVHTRRGVVGLSGKHNSDEVKAPRLSATNDWGKVWSGFPVSDRYWQDMAAPFAYLARAKQEGKTFPGLGARKDRVYLCVLCAFEDEVRRLEQEHDGQFVEALWRFVVGTHDHWKVECVEGHVLIQAVNPNGGLPGAGWRAPVKIEMQRDGNNVLMMRMDEWLLKWRLHNASTRVEPSLKFSVTLEGMPASAMKRSVRV